LFKFRKSDIVLFDFYVSNLKNVSPSDNILFVSSIMSSNLHLTIKNFIRTEYSLRAEILGNICKHIDNMNRESIVHHTNRNKLMNKVGSCIIMLNTSYNNSLPLYKNLDYVPSSAELTLIESGNFPAFLKLTSTCGSPLRDKINEYFANVDSEIYELMKTIGSKSISDVLRLSIGSNYRETMGIDSDLKDIVQFVQENKKNTDLKEFMIKLHNSSALIDILEKQFIPVEIKVSPQVFDNPKTTVLINRHRYDGVVNSEESSKFKFEIMLENCFKITIKCAKTRKTFIIYGYFDYDVTNTSVTTSQVCTNYVYQKKKLLIDYARENANINREYKDVYLSNMSLGDILSFKGEGLVEKMLADYELYTKACNIKFKVTVNDFLTSDLTRKYNILRCLLLGPKSSIKNAAMLFGMTKDQNRDSKNNKTCVADILFRNLNHSQQCRLRKSEQYVKQELERLKKMTSDDMDLKQQCIMNNNMNDYVKKCALSRLEEMKSSNSEYHKNLTYVKTLIDYPWVPDDYCDMFTTIGKDLNKCREKLRKVKEEFDTRVFGQTEFKTVIGDIVSKWFTNPESLGKAIGLCGPPGCGKTLIASGLGKVLNIPYQEIHLGGLEDGSVLNGHSFTYSGAQPGLIVTKMVAAGEPRCVLFFDELDKACTKHGVNEVFNVLIHATDPNTNSKFSDKFFQDVTFPLNKCIFVFSFNDASKIDPILKDRMEIIEVSPYSLADKLEISKSYLIPEVSNSVGIEKGSILMTPQTIEHIVTKYTLEAGVRRLRGCIEKIFLKLNVDRIYGRGPFKNKENFSAEKPIRITKKHILKYLGKPKITIEKIHNTDQIGVINGMYATTAGSGGILPILVYPAKSGHNKPTLELTGKQGKVMRESVNFAWTIAKNCSKNEVVEKFYKHNKGGIHVHTPDGAVPKDGPSAGSAFTTAFLSRLTGFPIKHEVAMTGEISIGGNVTAIGGLEHKLAGAKVAGVKLVFVCEENLDDLKKIKESNPGLFNLTNVYKNPKVQKVLDEVCKKKNSNVGDFKIIVVNTIYDIIPYALLDKAYIKKTYKNRKYTVYDKTCDWKEFMIKNDGGFDNNLVEIDDVVVNEDDDENDVENLDDDNDDDENNEDAGDDDNDDEDEGDDDEDESDDESDDKNKDDSDGSEKESDDDSDE
ncbi:lon protease homolog, partial [Yasminevirus sp. GU-2018]